MAGYTRQSIAQIINGSAITAPPLNAEFNQLEDAFDASTGHNHTGAEGDAPKINLTTSVSGYLPAVHGGVGGKNNLSATSNPSTSDDSGDGYAPGSLWENTTTGRIFICVGNTANAAVWRELVQVTTSNLIEPIAHDQIDLGSPSVRFQDLYLSGGIGATGNASLGGTLSVTGASTFTGAVTANGGLTVNGTTTLAGNVTIGDALSSLDTIAVAAGFTSNLLPDTNAGVSLGSSTKQWNNLYIDGTATIDTLTVDENTTVAGTLGVTGTSTLSTANITNITATGTINLAGATVSNLGTVTTAAIGGGSLNNVVIGGSTPAAITGTTITGTSLVGPLTGNVTGNVTGNLTGNVTGDVTGDLTGNVTATSGTSNFTNVTISGQLNMDASSSGTITNLTAPSNDLDAATKLYVDTAVSNLVDSAPDSLNTLNELAAAINDDASAYNTLNTAIGNKLPKAGGTMSGAINMGGQKITNAADPTAAQDLATKNYIDTTYVDYSSAGDAANDARKLATNAEDVQFTLADGSTTGYSALHYAAKAAASYDSFDDRYLGSKASDPTLDNDNNALITGALYFDSTNGVMKVYNGTEWANASSSIEGIKSNFYYTATSGQTGFSGTDDNSNTLVIDKAGLVNVYMNGVRLHEDDYTVSAAGDSVTLAVGAATGDLIYLEVFGNFAGQSGADVAITGGSITGLTSLGVSGGNATFGDNDKAIFGAGSDLQIYHTGSTSYIYEQGTGDLRIRGSEVRIEDGDGSTIALFQEDGGAQLRHNGTTKVDTTSTGIDVTGAITATDRIAGDGSEAAPAFRFTNDTNTGMFPPAGGDALGFSTGGSEAARFDSSGDFLIGTTDKTLYDETSGGLSGFVFRTDGRMYNSRDGGTNAIFNRLTSDGDIVQFRKDGTTVGTIGSNTTGGQPLLDINANTSSNSQMRFTTSGTERVRIDHLGNIGIGVTPKTGGATWQHIQFGGTGNLVSRHSDSVGDAMFANNYYVNGSGVDSYITGGSASRLFLNDNEFRFDTAPTGTADAALTFTSSMKLTAGNLLFGANTVIGQDTSDGSDNRGVFLCGGASQTVSRGGSVRVYGNEEANTGDVQIYSGNASTSNITLNAYGSNSTIQFTTNGGSERMRVSNDGVILIGTTNHNNANNKLYIKRSAVAQGGVESNYWQSGTALTLAGDSGVANAAVGINFLAYNNTGANNAYIEAIGRSSSGGPAALAFGRRTGTNTYEENARFAENGNLLVGKTSDVDSGTGVRIRRDGLVQATRANADPLSINRTGSDGDLAIFRIGGVEAGSIGTAYNGSDRYLNIGSGNVNLYFFDDASPAILPRKANDGASDGYANLGNSGNRFKSLYLSGGVYVGGTASANRLDDYEEGTWTPTCPTGTPTITGTATYVKIGKMVFIAADVQMPNQTNSSQAQIRGLPFTPYARGTNSEYNISPGEHTYGSYITLSLHNSYPAIVFRPSGGTSATYTVVSAKRFRFAGWYEVA